jgi:hypothetical protein
VADIQTVFGSINSVLEQSAVTAEKIRSAITGSPVISNCPAGTVYDPVTRTCKSVGVSSQETMALVVLFAVIGLVVFLIWREG